MKKYKSKRHKLGKRIAKKKLNLPYRILGTGKKRIVYALNKAHVLKVAILPNGIKNNRREVRIYKKAHSKVKKHFAKIVAHGRGWLIMKKFTKRVPSSKINKVLRLKRKLIENGIHPDDFVFKSGKKFSRSNIRLSRNGRIVIIDYGNFTLG